MNHDELLRFLRLLAPEWENSPLEIVEFDGGHCQGFVYQGSPAIAVRSNLPRNETLAVVVHEGAHLLLVRQPMESAPIELDEEVIAYVRDRRKLRVTKPRPTLDGAHGVQFLRRCCHLHYRALQAGYEIPLGEIVPSVYGLSPAGRYRTAFGDEMERLRSASFAAINNEPLPPEVITLFNRDVARYERKVT